MKTVLTIALIDGGKFDENQLFGGAEVIALEGDTPLAGLRKAKGKYTVLVGGEAKVSDLANFLTTAESSNADLISFEGGTAFRTGILQRITLKNLLPYSAELTAMLSCKSVQKTDNPPLTIAPPPRDLSDEAFATLAQTIGLYTASKGKAPLELYGMARDMICAQLTGFYLEYMLEIFKKTREFQPLVDFDAKIATEDKVLYLVFENRFSQLFKLKKLRDKNFKINLFEMLKVKTLLK